MRSFRKIKLIITLVLVLVTSAILFVGCSDDSDQDVANPIKKSLTLNKTEINLLIGETFVLESDYEIQDGATLTFESQNPEIASVDAEGKIVGNQTGETVVKATYGSEDATCKVIVGDQGMVPYLEFVYGVDDKINCLLGESVNLAAMVNFNNQSFQDATITYNVANPEITEVNDKGMLTAKKKGTVNVAVSASWRGFDKIVKNISVTVVDKIECLINQGKISEFNLYTIDKTFRGVNYDNSIAIDVDVIAGATQTIEDYHAYSSDENVFKLVSGSIVAQRAGQAKLIVEFTHDNFDYSFDFTVNVIKPVLESATEMLYFDATEGKGENAFNTYFDGADLSNIYTATAESIPHEGDIVANTTLAYTPMSGSNAEVLANVPVNGEKKVKQIVTLEDDVAYYRITLTPYTAVIADYNDLAEAFPGTSKISSANWNGYYILTADIQAYTNTDGGRTSGWHNDKFVFTGTFDGNGYRINGLGTTNFGLLGFISGSATIKNLALTNVYSNDDGTKEGSFTPLGYIKESQKPTFTNLYIQYSATTFDNTTKKFNVFSKDTFPTGVKMNNVVVDMSAVTLTNDYNVNIFAAWANHFYNINYDGNAKDSESAKYADTCLANINKQVTDVIVISKSPLMYHPASETSNPSIKCLRIIDAVNKADDESYIVDAEHQARSKHKLTFTGVNRYNALTDFVTAIGEGLELSVFTETNLWKTDATYGLTWNKPLVNLQGE